MIKRLKDSCIYTVNTPTKIGTLSCDRPQSPRKLADMMLRSGYDTFTITDSRHRVVAKVRKGKKVSDIFLTDPRSKKVGRK